MQLFTGADKMAIDVTNISHLARLHIDQDKLASYEKDLSNIMHLVEQMNQVDVAAVVPLSNPLDASQRLRSDQVTERDQREKFQAIAPHVANGLYLVPQVIEQ